MVGSTRKNWQKVDPYTLENLPAHALKAQKYDELAEILLNLSFAQHRFGAIGPYGYTRFLREVVRRANLPKLQQEELRAIERVLDQNAHLLARNPALFLQHVQNGLEQRLA